MRRASARLCFNELHPKALVLGVTLLYDEKVHQEKKDQEKAQSEKIPTPKIDAGNNKTNNKVLIP